MPSEALSPNLLALGAVIAICALFPRGSNRGRTIFAMIAIAAGSRYLWWRWTETVYPVDFSTGQGLWILGCFSLELLVMLDNMLGQVALSRTIDRSAEADRYEARMRGRPLDHLPSVDVFIPTYDEEHSVLERSIVGALALDYPNFTVWVLDDGRRPWLAALCAAKGARYLTRPDNEHAKAGNINAALPRTNGDLIAVLDADFVPRRNFLWRTVGFFDEPRVACLQTPQHFFNKDHIQTNLGLGGRWSDDQRLFFDLVMPSRDAWGAAFSCGTGCLMRRTAFEAISGMAVGSICEDMLTSMVLKRHGFETIYLNEALCIGLAPESTSAFFVQRSRWARGHVQMLFLKNGIFGPNLPFLYRLLSLPGYWILQVPVRLLFIALPLLYLMTGTTPLVVTDSERFIAHLGPAMITGVGLIWWLARDSYCPLLTDAAQLFLAIRVAPATLLSLAKPFGLPFRVTPKGASARGERADRTVLWICLGLLIATIAAMAWNGLDDWHTAADRSTLPLSAVWATINCTILGLAAMIACEGRRDRSEERFSLDAPARCAAGDSWLPCVIADASLTGARLVFPGAPPARVGARVTLDMPEIGRLTGRVMRADDHALGVVFEDLPGGLKDNLIRHLYTLPRRVTLAEQPKKLTILGLLARHAFGRATA
ncbi:MAG TPA: glycosyltransferase [Aliidongia sp.]|nr:glycosyltransferase [Aliidongia sp.]